VVWALVLADSALVILLEEARPVRLALGRVVASAEAVTMAPTSEQETLTPTEAHRAADSAPEVAPEVVSAAAPPVEWGVACLGAPASAVASNKALGVQWAAAMAMGSSRLDRQVLATVEAAVAVAILAS